MEQINAARSAWTKQGEDEIATILKWELKKIDAYIEGEA